MDEFFQRYKRISPAVFQHCHKAFPERPDLADQAALETFRRAAGSRDSDLPLRVQVFLIVRVVCLELKEAPLFDA